jgi:putative addiction module component (TIGR02574 family)
MWIEGTAMEHREKIHNETPRRRNSLPDAGRPPELTNELKAELDRRLDALDANPKEVVSWEEIERHVGRER